MFSLITDKKVTQPSISSVKIFDDTYKDGLAELVIYYAKLDDIKEMILKFGSVRMIIGGFYEVMVKSKNLDPVESLEKSEKERIWSLTKGNKNRLEAARAIYLIEKITPSSSQSIDA